MDTGRQKCRAFEESRDMRIVNRVHGKAQSSSNLRMRLGKFGRQPAQRIQFAVVVRKQRVGH